MIPVIFELSAFLNWHPNSILPVLLFSGRTISPSLVLKKVWINFILV
jgi:hypothetical protein